MPSWTRPVPSLAAALALLLLLPAGAGGVQAGPERGADGDYARYLVREGDYHRAVDIYKRIAFEAEADSARLAALLWVARCERWQGSGSPARRYAAHVLAHGEGRPPFTASARIELAALELAAGQPPAALSWLDGAGEGAAYHPLAWRGLALAELGAWERLDPLRRRLAGAGAPEPLLAAFARTDSLAARAPRTSPALAAALSTLLPGAGQLYAGHPVDGLQAFAFVGAFALSTATAWRYEERERGGPGGLTALNGAVAALFHLANVVGAHRTARYRNLRRHQLLLEPLEGHVREEWRRSRLAGEGP